MGTYYPELSDSDYLSEIGQYTRDMATTLEQPWQDVTLLNGWTIYSGGGGYDTVSLKARRLGNLLQMTGMIKHSNAVAGGTNKIIGALPAGLEPAQSMIIACPSNAYAAISIGNAGGELGYYSGPTNPTFISINFTVALDNAST